MDFVLNFSQIVNTSLFIISGFFFGIFSSRQSLSAAAYIRRGFKEHCFSPFFLLQFFLRMLFLLCTFLLFPSWFAARTMIGALVYYTVLLFFFSKGWKNTKP